MKLKLICKLKMLNCRKHQTWKKRRISNWWAQIGCAMSDLRAVIDCVGNVFVQHIIRVSERQHIIVAAAASRLIFFSSHFLSLFVYVYARSSLTFCFVFHFILFFFAICFSLFLLYCSLVWMFLFLLYSFLFCVLSESLL